MIEKFVSEYVKEREKEEILEIMYGALKKQIAVQVFEVSEPWEARLWWRIIKCPACNQTFTKLGDEVVNYCPICGQKLRWSE